MKRYLAQIMIRDSDLVSIISPKGGKVIHAKGEENALLSAKRWMEKFLKVPTRLKHYTVAIIEIK